MALNGFKAFCKGGPEWWPGLIRYVAKSFKFLANDVAPLRDVVKHLNYVSADVVPGVRTINDGNLIFRNRMA